MTAEQNIIACAVQLAHDNDRYLECLDMCDGDESCCVSRADARETAIERLCQALRTAGIDVRDLAVWDRWRKRQGFDEREATFNRLLDKFIAWKQTYGYLSGPLIPIETVERILAEELLSERRGNSSRSVNPQDRARSRNVDGT
jgi:hypothetical protein